MDQDATATAFANRDDPIPVLAVASLSSQGSPAASSDAQTENQSTTPQRKPHGILQHGNQESEASGNTSSTKASLQDRLLAKLLQQVIPSENSGGGETAIEIEGSSTIIQRPGFSLPLMTANFRRFNARIGVAFVLQKHIERLLTWRTPSHTLSLVAILTFVCLNPFLLAALVPASVVLFVMVPAFLVRHPPPPTATIPNSTTTYSLTGPPLAPAKTIRPAGEMSKDFFRNMRDLQNSMEDFAVLHDLVIQLMTPYTNFSDERSASAVFLSLVITCCTLLLVAHLLPWRFLALVTTWSLVGLGHPNVQTYLRRQPSNPKSSSAPTPLSHLRTLLSNLAAKLTQDITLTSPAQTAEVEIFELQRLQRGEYVPWMFSPNPYDPLSPIRISGANSGRPKGTRFFDDVAAPTGWEWVTKKWDLDMNSKGWVEERMVQSVMVEEEGERWVIDLLERDRGTEDPEAAEKGRNWEVRDGRLVGSVDADSQPGRKGEWRRRRWIRVVKRKPS